jgi:hypothetical protein
VTFFDGTTTLDSSALVDGRAVWRGTLSAGTHTLTASFSGNPGFNSSTSPAVTETIATDTSGCAPVITVPPMSVEVPEHTNVPLTVVASGAQPQTVQWFLGVYPNISLPLATPLLEDVTAPTELWVQVTNSCGSAYATALITIAPPHHRATKH